MVATLRVSSRAELDEAMLRAVTTEALGPLVPLAANSPNQWIAVNGMVLRARIGSEVQGMSTGGSDIDEMGICLEPHETVIGHRRFEHYTWRTQSDGVTSGPGDLDLTVYSLRKFVHLVTAGNPTVLMMLFLPDEHLLFRTPVADELLARRDLFLSRQAGPKFRGYLESQRRGLLGLRSGGSRNQGRQDIRDRYGFDVKFAAHMVRLGIQGVELLTTGRITLPIPEPDRTWLLELRRGEHTKQEALERAERLEARIDGLMEARTSPLPDQPDHARIDGWMAGVHRGFWGWT
jgi:hypothetical protein